MRYLVYLLVALAVLNWLPTIYRALRGSARRFVTPSPKPRHRYGASPSPVLPEHLRTRPSPLVKEIS